LAIETSNFHTYTIDIYFVSAAVREVLYPAYALIKIHLYTVYVEPVSNLLSYHYRLAQDTLKLL